MWLDIELFLPYHVISKLDHKKLFLSFSEVEKDKYSIKNKSNLDLVELL